MNIFYLSKNVTESLSCDNECFTSRGLASKRNKIEVGSRRYTSNLSAGFWTMFISVQSCAFIPRGGGGLGWGGCGGWVGVLMDFLYLDSYPFYVSSCMLVQNHCPLVRESTGDQWIPYTKGQWCEKCFHAMTSSFTCISSLFIHRCVMAAYFTPSLPVISFSGDQSDTIEMQFSAFKFLYSERLFFRVTVRLCETAEDCAPSVSDKANTVSTLSPRQYSRHFAGVFKFIFLYEK